MAIIKYHPFSVACLDHFENKIFFFLLLIFIFIYAEMNLYFTSFCPISKKVWDYLANGKNKYFLIQIINNVYSIIKFKV